MRNRNMPVISIVGRPNVGKSSLFNRLIGGRPAVVEKKEGTTRDRVEKAVSVGKKSFILVDTGGFLLKSEDEIYSLVKMQIEKAIKASDVILFVCDGKSGLLPLDFDLARILRKSGRKIELVVNKMDNEKIEKENLLDFYQLGFGEPLGISCLHNRGIGSLLDEVLAVIPERSPAEAEKGHPIKIAIVGRPNVGKSSFLNKILNEERAIVHEKPGTTRDSLDTYFEKDGLSFLLIDTAGIRHKRKVKSAVLVYSMMRARDAIDRSDIALLLIDGMEGVTADDIKILDYIKEKGKGCAIIINKWDLVKNIEMSRYKGAIFKRVPDARNFPVAFVSAKTGRNVPDAFELVKAIRTNAELFIDTDMLTELLDEIKLERVKLPRGKRPPKFYYMIQARTFPKEFLIFVNDPRSALAMYATFIENRLREKFPLLGVPVRIRFKKLRRTPHHSLRSGAGQARDEGRGTK